MPRARDFQRTRVYAAERTLPEFASEGLDVPAMQRLVDDLLVRLPYTARTGRRCSRIRVKDGRGRRNAAAFPSRWSRHCFITMPRWSRSRLILAHEVAHILHKRRFPADSWHGPGFCAVYLETTAVLCGPEVAARLREAFDAGNVAYCVWD